MDKLFFHHSLVFGPVLKHTRHFTAWTNTDGTYESRLDLAGVAPADLDVQYQAGVVRVTVGETERESVRIPVDADPNTLAAKMQHGRLTLTVAQRKWRKIPVSS